MAGRFRGCPVTRAKKRMSLWLEFSLGENTQASAGSTLVASLNAAALALRPFTIVRTHIELMLQFDQAATPENQRAAFGCTVVTDQAVAVGITAVPTPGTDLASDWFAHQIMFGNGITLTDRVAPPQLFTIDSKAMRKVDVGADLVFVLENTSSMGLVLHSGGRVLIKTN